MLEELGMSGSSEHRGGGAGSGYVEFGGGRQGPEKRAAPTPPPRNASAQKKTPQTHDRVMY